VFSLGGRDKVDSAPQAEYVVHEAQLMQLSPNKPAVRDLSPTSIRHFGGMPHSLVPPSKWDTSNRCSGATHSPGACSQAGSLYPT